jgi:diketogulonate reductase-like aldo/keto reductase/ferredoxin
MNRAGVPLGPDLTIPLVGLGTWEIRGEEVATSLRTALEVGYRHIDTAAGYDNEAAIGAALQGCGLDRADLFLTSKIAPRHRGRERQTLEASLRGLRTEYLDLWLVHAFPGDDESLKLWELLIAAQQAGWVRAIGVSNYSTAQIDDLTRATGVVPAVNQVRWRPAIFDATFLRQSADRGVVLEGFSALRQSDLSHPTLVTVAAAHRVTPAQVVLRWHLEHGVVTLPRSTRPERIAQNFALWDFRLSATEVAQIDAMNATTADEPDAAQRRGPDRPSSIPQCFDGEAPRVPKVTYRQSDGTTDTIDVPLGESVMSAAVTHAVPGIVAECGGNAMCATCHVYVDVESVERLPEMAEDEDEMLDGTASERTGRSRLSCQLTMTDDLAGLVVDVPVSQV